MGSERTTIGGYVLPENWIARIALIWSGNAVSFIAAGAASYACVWYVTVATGSPIMLALIYVAAFLPLGLLSPFGGVIADKVNRKAIILASDMTLAVSSIAMAALIFFTEPSIPVILACCLVYGIASAFRGPAFNATMPLLVPADANMRINTLDGMLSSVSVIIAPVFGIFLYTTMGLQLVLFVNGICALASFAAMLLAKMPPMQAAAADLGVVASLGEGVRTLGGERGLLYLLIAIVLCMTAYGPIDSLLPLVVSTHFGGDGYTASLLAAAMGVGMLVGSGVLVALNLSRGLAKVVCGAIVLAGVAIAAAGLVPSDLLLLFVVFIVIVAIASAWLSAPIVTLLQVNVAEDKLGRVMGLYTAAMGLTMPVGTLIGGAIAEFTGVQIFFVADGILIALIGLAVLLNKKVGEYNRSILPEESEVVEG